MIICRHWSKEGNPSEEVLREARQALTVEFAELSGDTGLNYGK